MVGNLLFDIEAWKDGRAKQILIAREPRLAPIDSTFDRVYADFLRTTVADVKPGLIGYLPNLFQHDLIDARRRRKYII